MSSSVRFGYCWFNETHVFRAAPTQASSWIRATSKPVQHYSKRAVYSIEIGDRIRYRNNLKFVGEKYEWESWCSLLCVTQSEQRSACVLCLDCLVWWAFSLQQVHHWGFFAEKFSFDWSPSQLVRVEIQLQSSSGFSDLPLRHLCKCWGFNMCPVLEIGWGGGVWREIRSLQSMAICECISHIHRRIGPTLNKCSTYSPP